MDDDIELEHLRDLVEDFAAKNYTREEQATILAKFDDIFPSEEK